MMRRVGARVVRGPGGDERRVERRWITRGAARWRRVGSATAAVLCALCAVACGSGNSPSRKTIEAYARAVNLRASDLPGWVQVKPELGRYLAPPPKPAGPVCATPGGGHEYVVESARLQSAPGDSSVERADSSVVVLQSPAEARARIARASTSSARECIRRLDELAARAAGPLVTQTVSMAPLPGPLPGWSGATMRIALHTTYRQANPREPRPRANAAGSDLRLDIDLFTFASGRAVISFEELHEPKRDTTGRERKLLRALANRAAAAHI